MPTNDNSLISEAINFKAIFDDQSMEGITIPIIQRDYAQGRDDTQASRVRHRFLSVLHDALVSGTKVSLDFIYGSVENGRLVPLDGQQRLTTLFLLHYYIARHENVDEKEWSFLRRFSYETRVSSREFCFALLDFKPDFTRDTLSESIRDEAWFLMEWESDPTVTAMLVMLDAIHTKFHDSSQLWPRLTGDAVTFFFLSIKDMGLTDDLYIKMNSRGKPLSDFEHFKAELELQISKYDTELAHTVAMRFDCEWTNMLWPLRNSGTGNKDDDNTVDDEFLRLIHFVSDDICFDSGLEPIDDHFDLIAKLYSPECPKAKENVERLLHFMDRWSGVGNTDDFFARFVTNGKQHVTGKIKRRETNLFAKCCSSYGTRAFTLGDRLMLDAFTLYIGNVGTIAEEVFRRRIRILNNLVNNSSDNLRVNYKGEYLFDSFKSHVAELILHGTIEYDENPRRNFQPAQRAEELAKMEFTTAHPELAETLFRLEDHPYLNGYIHSVGLENIGWCDRFYSLFNCHPQLITRALLSVGDRDYFVKDTWRRQIGISIDDEQLRTRIWRDGVFSPQHLDDNFCDRLRSLLSIAEEFTSDILEEVIHKYMDNATSFPPRYYLVKYHDTMLDCNPYGKYYTYEPDDGVPDRYNLIMMTTEKSIGGKNYNVFLNTLYECLIRTMPHMQLPDYAYYDYRHDGCSRLYFGDGHSLTMVDSIIRIYDAGNNVLDECRIKQDGEHTDTEDRVQAAKQMIAKWYNTDETTA